MELRLENQIIRLEINRVIDILFYECKIYGANQK